jgi:hypothetical protein
MRIVCHLFFSFLTRSRFRRGLFSVAALMLALAGQGWAQVVPRPLTRDIYTRPKPDVEKPAARVAEHIGALNDESPATRRNARQALLAMGPAIQPQLRWALEEEDKKAKANPAVLSRVHAELLVLMSYLDDARLANTSTVTLHRKDAPLLDTLREVGVQVEAGTVRISGNDLADKLELLGGAKVSLDIEKLDYWSALAAIRAQTGFIEYFNPLDFHRPRENDPFQPDPRMPYDVKGATTAGPFLIAPAALEARGANLRLVIDAMPESKVLDESREGGRYAFLQIDEYKDDQGQSLLPSGQPLVFPSMPDRVFWRGNFNQTWAWRIEALLPRPAAGRRIGSLKGRLGISVGPRQSELTVVDLTRGTGQLFEFDGVAVLVTSVVPSDSTYTVTGEIIAPTNSPVGRALSDKNATADYLGLRDMTGVQLPRDVGPSSVRSEAGVTTMTWTLRSKALRQPDGIPRSSPPPGGSILRCTANCVPAALYWVTPVDMHWFQAPFELRDIAVPPN